MSVPENLELPDAADVDKAFVDAARIFLLLEKPP